MAIDIQIQDIRFSFLWTETLPEILSLSNAGKTPMPFLQTAGQYAATMNALLQGESNPNGLKLPWNKLQEQRFWQSYFSRDKGKPIIGNSCWRGLVPLRGTLPFKAMPGWIPPVAVWMEGFYYPHGIALAFHARSQTALPLEQAVDLAYTIKRDGRYTLAGTGYDAQNVSLNQIAKTGLTALRNAVLGANAATGKAFDSEPYSLVTIARAGGADAGTAPTEGQDLHRALNALANWPEDWRKDSIAPLAEAKRATDSDMKASVLFTQRRGQAIWCPNRFVAAPETKNALSCYHNNLVFAMLQTESLCGLASAMAAEIRAHNLAPLSSTYRDCAKLAASVLGVLYGGSRASTYCCSAIPQFIQANNRAEDIELVRKQFSSDSTALHSTHAAAAAS